MLIRGKYVIADPHKSGPAVKDGAVYVRRDKIAAVGAYGELARRYPQEEEVGSDDYLVLPGLINAHDHGRVPSAVQMGVADDYLEMWLLALMEQNSIDPYLITAYASARLIESGVTTVTHSYYHPVPEEYESGLAATAEAYEQAGLRSVLALSVLDESPITAIYRELLPGLPAALQAQVRERLKGRKLLSSDDFFGIYRRWCQKCDGGRVRVMLGPVSVHWCSEALLVRIQQEAEASDSAVQAHALETVHQRDQALKKHGKTVITWLDEIGFLSPRLSCAHCVWVTEEDVERLAERRVSVVHNPSSNLRLGSGIAPVRAMQQKRVNVALGMDGHTLNDDGDMLQEMRLAAHLHRFPGGGASLTAQQALAMATCNGARALGMERTAGTLEVGKKADVILVRLDSIYSPFVDPGQDVASILLHRAKAQDVDTVIVDGQVVMREGKILTLDKEAIAAELRRQLEAAYGTQRARGESLARQLQPYADGRFENRGHQDSPPFYLVNSRQTAAKEREG